MADPQHGHGHHGPKVQTYIIIGLALAAFTVVSFIVNGAVRGGTLTADQGFWIILAVAVVKASLVIFYFMHLIWDWKKVAFMIAPALILGTMMVIVLMPDIVLAWTQPAAAEAQPNENSPHPEH